MRKAGWIGIGAYVVLALVGAGFFLMTCEEIGCLGVVLIPSLPGALLFVQFIGPFGILLGVVINLLLAYWIGIGIGRAVKHSRAK